MKIKYLLPIVALILSINSFGQSKKTKLNYDQSLYSSVEYRLIGPFRGGRAGTAVGVLNNPNLYYMGTAGGGVWKTQDSGSTWEPISDGYFGGSIGAIAVSESDENIIYVGEGEQTLRGNVSSGHGMWKSTDAGETWKYIGLPKSEHISRIRIHPENPDIVYVGVIGNLWKPNSERGIYKTNNGGLTWEKILYVSDKAGIGDLVIDPNNSRIIYATTWQMRRNGYRMDSGGPDSKIFRSYDSGKTWEDISEFNGLPSFPWGIVGVAISPVNSKRIWVMVEADNGGLFRSDDGGNNWEKVNSNRALRQRAWYYTRIYADTQNEDKVFVLNVSYGVSTDGGKTFTLKNAPHGDHHDLWIDPNNNMRMVMADDGGAQVSNDGGDNWSTYFNQPTAQFYRVSTDNSFPYRIYGAQQDNSTVRIKHRTSSSSITERDWEPSAGGESAHLAPDPKNNDIVFGGTYKGYMMMQDHSNGQIRSVNVWPDNPAGSGAEVMKYRFNWNFPVMFSPNNPNKLYAGSNYLHVSENSGQTWKTISPDLTRNIPETIMSSGGPITQDNTGAEYYANIFAIAESKLEEGVIWVGSDDGLIHITKDGGKTWENITPPNKLSPELNMINSIDPSPFKKGKAYIAATSYKFGDYTPYLYKTEDYGKSWKLITDGINSSYYTRVVRSDKKREGLLYAGTEWGMYISFDDGNSWSKFQLNLPITSIRDLEVKDNDLVVATHGRSFWIIDDLTPLHQLNENNHDDDAILFKPDMSYRMAQSGGWNRPNNLLSGQNHPNGVIINYYIKKLQKDDYLRIDIEDKDGSIIRSFTNNQDKYSQVMNNDKSTMVGNPVLSNPNDIDNALSSDNLESLSPRNGGNRLIWDMRYPGFKSFEGMVLYSSPNVGPKATPGKYNIKMTYNDIVFQEEFEIVKDPRVKISQADYQDQLEFLIDVRDEVSRANQQIIDIRSIKNNMRFILDKTEDNIELQEMINKYLIDISVIENNIHMTKNQSRQDPLNFGIRINNRIAFLLADSQRGDYPPTDQSKEFFNQVKEELDIEIINLKALIEKHSQKIEDYLKKNKIELISFND
ncbi:MAG: glycosyl hydrolase [Candidatus Marisimplicoccus sp.]